MLGNRKLAHVKRKCKIWSEIVGAPFREFSTCLPIHRGRGFPACSKGPINGDQGWGTRHLRKLGFLHDL